MPTYNHRMSPQGLTDELSKGKISGEEHGCLSAEDVSLHFQEKYFERNQTAVAPMLLCAIIIMIIALTMCNSPINGITPATIGSPVCSMDSLRLDGRYQQVVAVNQYIYALMDNPDRVMQVYGSDGTYLCTYFFYDGFQNGRLMISENDGMVYLLDERNNLYRFSEGAYLDFIPQSEAATLLGELEFSYHHSTPGYWVDGMSIWVQREGQGICLVHAPAKGIADWLRMIFIFFAGLLFYSWKKPALMHFLRDR